MKNRGRAKIITQEKFCSNVPTPFPLHCPPWYPSIPPYYTLSTPPYTLRCIIFLSNLTRTWTRSWTSDLFLCNLTLYPLDHQGFVANFTHIFCYYNLFGPRPPNAWLILYKKMSWFEKNEPVWKKWTGLKKKIKPKIKLNHSIYKLLHAIKTRMVLFCTAVILIFKIF